jgi:hypothetical protein
MSWYATYGKLPVAGSATGGGVSLKVFPDEETAVAFAMDCVRKGLVVHAVGIMGSDKPKYRSADIARLCDEYPKLVRNIKAHASLP